MYVDVGRTVDAAPTAALPRPARPAAPASRWRGVAQRRGSHLDFRQVMRRWTMCGRSGWLARPSPPSQPLAVEHTPLPEDDASRPILGLLHRLAADETSHASAAQPLGPAAPLAPVKEF